MGDAAVAAVEQSACWLMPVLLGCFGVRGCARRETALSTAPVIAPTSSSFEASGVKTPLLRPSRSTTIRSATARTSSMLWLIMMTPRPRSRSRSTRFSTSRGLRDAERRRRLVEHDDLRVEQQRARDRHRLPLPARERGDDVAHARDARGELVQQRPGPHLHRHLVELPAGRPPGRGRCWPPRRGSRRARGPGTPWRCRGPARRSGRPCVTGWPWKWMRARASARARRRGS